MSMPISDRLLAFALLALAGCGQGSDDPRVVAGAVEEAQAARGRIGCTLDGKAADCTVERSATAEGQMLTLRGPDGGFHRVQVDAAGRGVAAADGAEPAVVTKAADGALEIAVGGDRYRLPVAGGRATP